MKENKTEEKKQKGKGNTTTRNKPTEHAVLGPRKKTRNLGNGRKRREVERKKGSK